MLVKKIWFHHVRVKYLKALGNYYDGSSYLDYANVHGQRK